MQPEELTAQLIGIVNKERTGAKPSSEIVAAMLQVIQANEPAVCPYLYRGAGALNCSNCETGVKWSSAGKRMIETNDPVLTAAVAAGKP